MLAAVHLFAAAILMALAVLADVGYAATRDRVVHRRNWIYIRNIMHRLLLPARVIRVVLKGKPLWLRCDIEMACKAMKFIGWRSPQWVAGDPD